MLLRKEYEGADEKGSAFVEMAKKLLGEVEAAERKAAAVEASDDDKAAAEQLKKDNEELLEKLEVTLSMTVTEETADGERETYSWPKVEQKVSVIRQDGTAVKKTWLAGGPFKVYPWQSVVITGGLGDGAVSYSLSESQGDRHWLYQWEKEDGDTQDTEGFGSVWVENAQKTQESDRPFTGTPQESPVATLVNQITGVPQEGSKIRKRMAPGSEDVDEGAELVWKVERYSGGAWIPAEGIPYLIFDDAGAACGQTLYTDAEGRLTLTKTAAGYPWVQFTEDTVQVGDVTGEEPEDGCLRVRELPEESDSSWGLPAWLGGWEETDGEYEPGWQMAPGAETSAFVNTNRTAPVRIGKAMAEATDQAFTMVLMQVTGVDWTQTEPDKKITQDNWQQAITERMPRAGIEYDVYETAEDGSSSFVGRYRTGADGRITLKAGQYAELDLPDKTLWTVSEEQTPGFTLKDMTEPEGADRLTQLAENLMLINQKAEKIPVKLDAETDQMAYEGGEKIEKGSFTVTLTYSDGTTEKLKLEDFSLDTEYAPDDERAFSVTVTYTDGATDRTFTDTVELTVESSSYDVKYAVSLYGINQDTREGGGKIGLTFGPTTARASCMIQSRVTTRSGITRLITMAAGPHRGSARC